MDSRNAFIQVKESRECGCHQETVCQIRRTEQEDRSNKKLVVVLAGMEEDEEGSRACLICQL